MNHTLLIDDAQNLMKKEQLEVLRLLQNLESHGKKLFNLVLFAQPEAVPAFQAHGSFGQRISSTYLLNPLSLSDTEKMIVFRLERGGLERADELFSPEAIRTLYEYCQGVPREICSLCRNAMTLVKERQMSRIDYALIVDAIGLRHMDTHVLCAGSYDLYSVA